VKSLWAVAVILGIVASVVSIYFLDKLDNRFGDVTPFVGLIPFLLGGFVLGFMKKGQSWILCLFILIVPGIIMVLALPQALFFTLGPFALTGFIMLMAACLVYTMLGFLIGKLIRQKL
jgi:predicted neutral ceramidase superfamily lipid hydrolase